MKKVITFMLFLVAAMPILAQKKAVKPKPNWDNKWVVINPRSVADPMKLNNSTTVYFYRVPGEGEVSIYDTGDGRPTFILECKYGIFNFKDVSTRFEDTSIEGCNVSVGYYNKAKAFQSKEACTMSIVDTDKANMLMCAVRHKDENIKVATYLMKADGYVRLIAPVYGEYSLDITVPCINGKAVPLK